MTTSASPPPVTLNKRVGRRRSTRAVRQPDLIDLAGRWWREAVQNQLTMTVGDPQLCAALSADVGVDDDRRGIRGRHECDPGERHHRQCDPRTERPRAAMPEQPWLAGTQSRCGDRGGGPPRLVCDRPEHALARFRRRRVHARARRKSIDDLGEDAQLVGTDRAVCEMALKPFGIGRVKRSERACGYVVAALVISSGPLVVCQGLTLLMTSAPSGSRSAPRSFVRRQTHSSLDRAGRQLQMAAISLCVNVGPILAQTHGRSQHGETAGWILGVRARPAQEGDIARAAPNTFRGST